MSEKIKPSSSLNYPPTTKQTRRIAQYCISLGISEPLEEQVHNRVEARNLIYELRGRLRDKNNTT